MLWNFTVLGEAASQLSSELRSHHDAIEWADPVRLRNRIVHGYWSVDMEVLVDTAHDDLPRLVDVLAAVLSSLE